MSVFKNKALTLLETIVFIGVFSIVGIIVFPFLINTLNYYSTTKGTIDITREARNIVLTLKSETNQSKKIDYITDWEIVFNKFNNKKSIFFKTSEVKLNFENMKIEGFISNPRIGSISLNGNNYGVNIIQSSNCSISSSQNITSLYSFSGYAWSPQIGWIKFRNTDTGESIYGVCLDSNNELRGFAYNDIIGWLVFNCKELGVCSTSNFKVINQNGYLKGFAWNDVLGWIFFDGDKGQVYLAQTDENFNITKIERISNPQVNVNELKFTPIDSSFKVDFSLIDEKNLSRIDYSTVISLPFK